MLPWYLSVIESSSLVSIAHWSFVAVLAVNCVGLYCQLMIMDPGFTRSKAGLSWRGLLQPHTSVCRYCPHCKAPKPPGTAHSRAEGRCVMQFDHYCLLIGRAVGGRTIGRFIRMLVWLLLGSGYVVACGVHGVLSAPDSHSRPQGGSTSGLDMRSIAGLGSWASMPRSRADERAAHALATDLHEVSLHLAAGRFLVEWAMHRGGEGGAY